MRRPLLFLLLLSLAIAPAVLAQQTITEFTRNLEKRDGYFPL